MSFVQSQAQEVVLHTTIVDREYYDTGDTIAQIYKQDGDKHCLMWWKE